LFVVQLVSSFQTEAQNRTVESDQVKQKLSSLRRMIARLLKSINDVSDTQLHVCLYFCSAAVFIFTTSSNYNNNFQLSVAHSQCKVYTSLQTFFSPLLLIALKSNVFQN